MHLIPLNIFLKKSQLQYSLTEVVSQRIFKPRKDCESVSLGVPTDWESVHIHSDRNWRMQLQGWAFFFPIMSGFDNYSDKKKLVDFFFEILTDWYRVYGEDPNDIVTTRMPSSYAWYDMSVGFRALIIAFFKNRIEYFNLEINEEQKKVLNNIIEKHILHLSEEKVFSLNNHGMFQIQGLMALIQVNNISVYQDQYNYAIRKMEELVRSQFDHMGIHLEHSPYYHFYALTIFQKIVLNDWYDSKPIIKELIAKAISVKKWLVDPLQRTVCIGDSSLSFQKNIDFMNNDFHLLLETQSNNGVLSNFCNSGYQIYRSAWNKAPKNSSYIFLMGMYHSKVHKHRDCLSFDWFENGRRIICDSGKYGYVSDEYRSYFLSHRAHNTVEIEGFDILNTDPYGSCLDQAKIDDDIIIMSGELNVQGIRHHRQLTISPGRWIIVMDKIKCLDSRKMTQWFHPGLDYKNASLDKNRAILTIDNYELIINCLDKTLDSQLYYGDKELKQGFLSEEDFIVESAYAIGFRKKTNDLEINTVLALSKESENEAINYYSNNKKVSDVEAISSSVPKYVLGKLVNVDRVTFKRYDLLEGKYTYAYLFQGVRLNFYGHIKKHSKKITIMLPGAVDRSKTIYNFQRHSWSDEIEGSVISFLDPTVSSSNDITIGWFQGDKKSYSIPVLIDFLKTILKNNNIKEEYLTIFGSSAGGFSSLKIANSFLNSKVIVINPQTRIYNYFIKDYSKLIKWIYPNLTPELAKHAHNEQLKINLNIKDRSSPVLYYQNIDDIHHMHNHLEPFIESIDKDDYEVVKGLNKKFKTKKNMKLIYYSDPKSGHNPISKSSTIDILNSR